MAHEEKHPLEFNHQNNKNPIEVVDLRRFVKVKKAAVSDNFLACFQESNCDIGYKGNSELFLHAMREKDFTLWLNTMKKEME